MSKFQFLQNDFSSGEISEKFKARHDTQEFQNGLLRFRDFLPMEAGGARTRQGFRAITTYYDVQAPLNIKWKDAASFRYILDDTEYILFILRNYDTDTGLYDHRLEIYRPDGRLFSLVTNFSGTETITTSKTTDLRVSQIGEVIFICSSAGDQRPLMITPSRSGVASAYYLKYYNLQTLSGFGEGKFVSVPYLNANIDKDLVIHYTHDVSYDIINMKTSSGADADFFETSHVGAKFRLDISGNSTIVEITAFVDASTVRVANGATDRTGPRPADGASTDNWRESAWSDYQGWPRTVTSHEQSLFWGGTKKSPDTIFKSLTGNYAWMMSSRLLQHSTTDSASDANNDLLGYFGDTKETDPISFILSSNVGGAIKWMESRRSLLVGTSNTEYAISGGDVVIGLGNVIVRPQTSHGSSGLCEGVGSSLLFVYKDGSAIRDFNYSDDNGSHYSNNLSIISSDLLYKDSGQIDGSSGALHDFTIKDMSLQRSRSILWLVSSDGFLYSLEYDRELGRKCWSKHHIQSLPGQEVKVKTVITGSRDYGNEAIWVAYTIEGKEGIEIAYMVPDFRSNTLSPEGLDVFYGDGLNRDNGDNFSYNLDRCLWTSALIPFSKVTRLYAPYSTTFPIYSNGDEVSVIADGEYLGEFTVADGEVDLRKEVDWAIIGIRYNPLIRTRPINMGGNFGPGIGQFKRIDKVSLILTNSKYVKVDNQEETISNDTSLVDDIVDIYPDQSPERLGSIDIEIDKPYPAEIVGIKMRGVSYD